MSSFYLGMAFADFTDEMAVAALKNPGKVLFYAPLQDNKFFIINVL
jgi:hypothetical protein